MFCKNFNAILVAEDTDSNRTLVTRTRCKMWSCPYCAQQNRRVWRARIIAHINAIGGEWCWFTLTAHGKKRGKIKSLENLRLAWDTLMKRMKRKYKFQHYVRVYEQHQDGSYHCHAIANFHFHDLRWRYSKGERTTQYSRWLAATAKDMRLGYYTHAANIDSTMHGGYVSSYVTKYMTKLSPEFDAQLGRVRHIQTSQGWAAKAPSGDLDWQIKAGIYLDDLLAASTAKITIIDIQTGQQVTSDDFLDTYVYPPEFSSQNRTAAYDAQFKTPSAGDET